MFDENAFSLDAFDQDSWLFLLDTPYVDLSRGQRIYVRSALESVYAISVANQIVSVAAINNISVLDAMQSVGVRADTEQVLINLARSVKAKIGRKQRTMRPKEIGIPNNDKAHIVARDASIHSLTTDHVIFARDDHKSVIAFSAARQLFHQHGKDKG